MYKKIRSKKILIAVIKKALIAGLLAAIFTSGIYKCPFKSLFGIDCPGCGMTRALIAALKLDFKTAFHYHPLFLLFGIETVYVFFYDWILISKFHNKKAEITIGVLSILLLLIVWKIRQL